jgi:cell division protease FtsH
VQQWWQASQTIEVLPYSEFEKLLAEGRIAEVTVTERHVTGKLKSPEGRKSTVVANRVEPGLAEAELAALKA